MQRIYLAGKYTHLFALVDDEDYEELAQHKWFYSSGYAIRNLTLERGGRTAVVMHREVVSFDMVDHKNRNKLDNRKENLREATKLVNRQNQGKMRKGDNRYMGVSAHGDGYSTFVSGVYYGTYPEEKTAALVVDEMKRRLWGAEATTAYNFPDERLPTGFQIRLLRKRAIIAQI